MYSKKLLLVGLFVLGVIGFLGRYASAATLGGFSLSCTGLTTCGQCFCTGGVEGGVFVKGSQLAGDTIFLNVGAPIGGLLACANSGSGNPSPGIQIVSVPGPQTLQATEVIQQSDIKGSKVNVDLLALLSGSALQTLANQFCPNSNWSGIDFVPCTTDPAAIAAQIRLALLDTNLQTILLQDYSCTRTCDIGFTVDTKTKQFSFNSLPYTCTPQ
jgi:hypothetical protein